MNIARWSHPHILRYARRRRSQGLSYAETLEALRFNLDTEDVEELPRMANAVREVYGRPTQYGTFVSSSTPTPVGKKR